MRSVFFLAIGLLILGCAFAADDHVTRPPIIQPTVPAVRTDTNTSDISNRSHPAEPIKPQPTADATGRPLLTNPALYGGHANTKRVYEIQLMRRGGAINPKLLTEIANEVRKVIGPTDCVAAGFFSQKVSKPPKSKHDLIELRMLARFREGMDMAKVDQTVQQRRNEFAHLVSKIARGTVVKNPAYPRLTRVDSDPILNFSGSTIECGAGKLSQCENGQACTTHEDCLSNKCVNKLCSDRGLRSAAYTVAPAAIAVGALITMALFSSRLM